MQTVPLIGRQDELEEIRKRLVLAREPFRFNIVGGAGLGKNAFLDHFKMMLKLDNDPNGSGSEEGIWKLHADRVEILEFSDKALKDDFFGALHNELQTHFGKEWQPDPHIQNDYAKQIFSNLKRLGNDAIATIIIIDNFQRILELMSDDDIRKLADIQPQNSYYMFVTDDRTLDEIAPSVTSSDFHRFVRYTFLYPLDYDYAIELAKYINQHEFEPANPLSSEHLGLIYRIAGGNPGLLLSVTRFLGHRIQSLANSELPTETLDDLSDVISDLPHDEDIRSYWARLALQLERLRLELREFLVNLGFGKVGSIKIADANRLMRCSVLGPTWKLGEPLDSELIRYTILTQLLPADLARAEEILFKLLRNAPPTELVTVSHIEAAFEHEQVSDAFIPKLNHAIENLDVMRRRFIDSTLGRLRKKINQSPNSLAFQIANARGQGYQLESYVSLDMLIRYGPKVFQMDKEILAAHLKQTVGAIDQE